MSFNIKNFFLILLGFAVVGFFSSCKEEVKLSNDELLDQAAISAEEGDWKTVEALAGKAVSRNDEDSNALVLYSLALENTGSSEAALKEIEKASKFGKDNFAAQFTAGRMLFSKGKYDEALAPLTQAYKLRPNDIDTIALLAQVNRKLGTPDATKYLVKLIKSKKYKNKPAPWNELAIVLAERGDLTKAYKYFARAYKYGKDDPTVILNIAVFLDKYRKDSKKAKGYYLKYLKMTAKNPELENQRQLVASRVKQINSSSGK
jgi:tetratricopeptide (TPR) repeat protein